MPSCRRQRCATLGHDVRLIMGNDPPGPVHPRPAPARRAARRPAGGRDPDRPLGDRAGERLAAEHHPQPALDPPDAPRARDRGLRPPPPARADDADAVHRRARVLGRADRRDAPRERRPRLDAARASRSGASSPSGSTVASPSPSRRAQSAQRWLPGEYEIVPNGVLIPDEAEPGGREHRIVFAGRQEPRKGLARAAARLAGDRGGGPARGCGSPAPIRSPSGCC